MSLPDCRKLTGLCIKSQLVEELPALPEKLESLIIADCRNLRALPELPPTLEVLQCCRCPALTALPASFSNTALAELSCSGCKTLKAIP
jgi:hypothetical protein